VEEECDTPDDSDDSQPLLILYDSETTGLSIYREQIIEIAAKIIACPVRVPKPTFKHSVRPSKMISDGGKSRELNEKKRFIM